MDWDFIIDRKRAALQGILATLVAMVGGGSGIRLFSDRAAPPASAADLGKLPATLPRRLRCAVLRILRPAESAVRRLVVVAARDIVVTLPQKRPRKPKPRRNSVFLKHGAVGTGIILPKGMRPPGAPVRPARRTWSLPFADPPRRVGVPRRPTSTLSVPRISVPGVTRLSPIRPRPSPHDRVDAARLALRLRALGRVLDDLPAQARRFARWRARARTASNPATPEKPATRARRLRRLWPLRGGRPPGSVKRQKHEVHEILKDLQYFAWVAMEQPDTS